MKFDLMLDAEPDTIGPSIEEAKAEGLDGGWVIETKHDPFLLSNTAASRETGLQVGTAVAVAFARNPMLLATLGNDLQLATKGKFVLGLGSQVKPHIERRFSMPWSHPAPRMKDMIKAIHAIWDSWEHGGRLAHEGEFYQHTLMTPMFSPGPNPYGRASIYLGALGPAMTELAGQYADGFIVHRFLSERFIEEVTLPRIQAGLAKRERPLDKPFEIVFPPFVAAADDEATLQLRRTEAKGQIAFYASTPAYRQVLEMYGWEALGDQLHALSREGKWKEMSELITDEMTDTFVVTTTKKDAKATLEKRFGKIVDRVILFPGLGVK